MSQENVKMLKRAREQSPPGDQSFEEPRTSEPPSIPHFQKRMRQTSTPLTSKAKSASNSTAAALVIHHVRCKAKLNGHIQHEQSMVFEDAPRLYERDSRASALRGKKGLHNLDRYTEPNMNENLVILRNYDCQAFHGEVQDCFVREQPPCHNPPIPNDLWPYFDVIRQTTDIATPLSENIQISKRLRGAMEILATAHPDLLPSWEKELVPPYVQLHHARSTIMSTASDDLDTDQHRHFMQMVNYVDACFETKFTDAEILFSKGLVTEEYLWMLFRPNDVVVSFEEGQPRGFITRGSLHAQRSTRAGKLKCYSLGFNNGNFTEQEKVFEFEWPSQEKGRLPMMELPVFPLRFVKDQGLKDELRQRGSMFWECRKMKFVAYNAPTTLLGARTSNGRYMVDDEAYRFLHYGGKADEQDPANAETVSSEVIGLDQPIDERLLLLLPCTIYGYALHDKQWRILQVKYISHVEWNKRSFDQLVLDSRQKELIQAVILAHMRSQAPTDVVEGKGNGLIMLLHGGPGTGKTLTAESVAELAEKPLYRVTCGDIGTDPTQVEKYLESVFWIGRRWQAVVLLDESDVFLEEREKTDLKRNALVSVFLRALEYYEGILILTSNRVGLFDEAFKSRMQLAIHYPTVDRVGRRKIWNNFINMLDQEQSRIDALPEQDRHALGVRERVNIDNLRANVGALEVAKLNGRQIRNAITTARQLARFRNTAMCYGHLEQTIEIANAFETYVEETHGHSAAEYARAAQTRYDKDVS